MLMGAYILVTEDDAIIGAAIADAVRDAGGVVVGPVDSMVEAYRLVQTTTLHGGILDVKLRDGICTPAAAELSSRECPVIISSGHPVPPDLLHFFPDIVSIPKPVVPARLVERLAELLVPRKAVLGLRR